MWKMCTDGFIFFLMKNWQSRQLLELMKEREEEDKEARNVLMSM